MLLNPHRFGAPAAPPVVTLLGSATWTTASGTKTVIATTTAGSLPVVITAHTGNTSASAPTDDNGDGGTWTAIATSLKATSGDTMIAWQRSAKWGNSVSTTITHAPGASTGGGLAVYEITNMTKVGASAVKQSANVDNQGTARPSLTFAATPQIGNPIIGVMFSGTNPAGVTERAGYTENFDLGYGTPAAGFQGMSLNSGETSATIQWGVGLTGSSWGGIIIELDASV